MAKYTGKQYYLGAWKYVMLDLLYLIPVVGLIFLIVHSFDTDHENRCHFARSHFAALLLVVIVTLIAGGAFYLVAGQAAFTEKMNEIWNFIIKGPVWG